ncbi:MAG: ribonucleoside-diphosphate reductase subunit alpha, partial [Proteobacteria bacterium]|nr:ribonucleoside-diphosphate reductase subunit alpha [Pseudomonadota bacterium]
MQMDTQTGSTPQPAAQAQQEAPPLSPSLTATAPGQLKIIKRNGTVVPYTQDKIAVAMTKAFLAVEGGTAAASPRIRELVVNLAEQMTGTFKRRLPSGGTLHIEEIQDQVELALMRSGEHKVARSYVLYREQRAQERGPIAKTMPTDEKFSGISVVNKDGSTAALDVARIRTIVTEACEGLSDVEAERIISDSLNNMYDGISATDVATSVLITARTLVEEEPNYTYVSARLLLDELRTEALTFLNVDGSGSQQSATQAQMATVYPQALKQFILQGIELELLAPQLADYDLERLGAAMLPERDYLFTYLGLQTLYDRYFIHSNDIRIELPQVFFMRIAMGLAAEEDDPCARAIEFYNLLSSFDYMSSTPTLFNAGTLRPQLSSCFLTTVPDDLHGIYGAI